MNLPHTIWRWLRSFGQHRAVKQEIDEELRFHLEQRTAHNIAAGMSPTGAAREARKRFGNVQTVREECRDIRGARFVETTLQDIRFGVRMLAKSPGFTAVAVATLALGIGANTAIFSVINSVLLRPLAYRDPSRLVAVSQSNPKRGYPRIIIVPNILRRWQEQNSTFERLGGEVYESLTLTGTERPEHLHAALTTPNFFAVFGVEPLLGRAFDPDGELPSIAREAILSYGLWRRAFSGDRSVIGKSITLSGLDYTVVGVMPQEFKIFNPPSVFGLPTGDVQPQLWVPYPQPLTETSNHFFLGFGRLKPGVQAAQAQAELTAIVGRLAAEMPRQKDSGANVEPLKEEIAEGARPALQLLWVAVGFVLLISCANVANLSLARSATRAHEFAVRAALGAARSRLLRQLFAESAILALAGGSLGSLLAWGGLAGLRALQPAKFPRLDEVQLDGPVLAFTLLVSLLTALIFGLLPALRFSKPDLNTSLKERGREASEGLQRRRARGLLVVAEVALAMVLLAGAGLMIGSFARLARVNPGFAPEHLLTCDFTPPGADYSDDAKRLVLDKAFRDAVQAQPGIKSVATVYGLPFGTMLNALCGAVIENGSAQGGGQQKIISAWRVVSPNYFKTMAIPVRAGRPFSDELDKSNSPPVAIVNEAFARKFFANENPLGKRMQIFTVSTNWCEIVGVAQDLKMTGLDAPAVPEVYQSDSQQPSWMFSLVVRSSLPSREVENLVRAGVAGVDKNFVPYNIRTMDSAIGSSIASQRFTTILAGFFAGLALTLTVVGIYGVISYSVSQQTREIGIRMALGASPGSVLSLILRQGMMPALAGVVIGLAGSFVLTRLIASQLFQTNPNDPITFAVVTALLILVALTACYLPARRAAKVDPMVALRYE